MKRVLLALILAFTLVGCTIIQPVIRDGLNEIGDSLSVLSYGVESIIVTPPDAGLHGLILDVQGVALTVTHDACRVLEVGHVQCSWGIVDEVIVVGATGFGVSATATYRLAGEHQVRHEILGN